jgi:hypothetical protein
VKCITDALKKAEEENKGKPSERPRRECTRTRDPPSKDNDQSEKIGAAHALCDMSGATAREKEFKEKCYTIQENNILKRFLSGDNS